MNQPQENAIGLPIIYQVNTDQVDVNGDPVPRDISGATVHTLIFKKPDGARVEKAASFVTDGSDGLLLYQTADGDLSPYGAFEVQAYLVEGGLEEYTEVAIFNVNRNL